MTEDFASRCMAAVAAVAHAEGCHVANFEPMNPSPQAAPLCTCGRDARIAKGMVEFAHELRESDDILKNEWRIDKAFRRFADASRLP